MPGESWKPNLEENVLKVLDAHNSLKINSEKEIESGVIGIYKF